MTRTLLRHHHPHRRVSARYLFLALLAQILFFPLSNLGQGARYFIYAINWIVLGTAVYTVADTRRRKVTVIALAAVQVGIAIWVLLLPASSSWLPILRPLEAVLLAAFYLYAIRWMLADILLDEKVTQETLYGGLAVYLMLGLAWASTYAALELVAPESLNIDAASHM